MCLLLIKAGLEAESCKCIDLRSYMWLNSFHGGFEGQFSASGNLVGMIVSAKGFDKFRCEKFVAKTGYTVMC